MPLVFASPLAMTAEQRAQLETMARSTSLPHRKVVQAKALLLAADGVGTNEVARRCGTTDDSVRAWRRHFAEKGVHGVGRIAPGRGRRSWVPEGTVQAVVYDTLHAIPDDGSTHWTTRSMAARPQASPVASALRPDQLQLAQPGRALVQRAHRPSATPWRLHQRGRSHRLHRDLGRALERRPEALRVAQDG